jgi:hypothetical protein
MGKDLDALAKGLAEERISRGGALKRMGAVLLGGLLASVPMTAAFADPQTCVTCVCGVGRQCNAKESFCTEIRAHADEVTACQRACSRRNRRFCGGFNAFHCPRGCPA